MEQKRRNKTGYPKTDKEGARERKAEKRIKRKLKEKSRQRTDSDKG